jgi:Contractile injection system tube protein
VTVKARLIKLTGNGDTEGEGFDVQFNPTSLTIQYRSHAGQEAKGAALPAQYLGLRTATMSVDLIFDTADTGGDVRELTGRVLAFIDPTKPDKANKSKSGKSPPPRLKFKWGTFFISGVINEASEELDLWSRTGNPLHAKVHLSIEGQDPLLRKAMTSPSRDTMPGRGQQNRGNPAAPGTPDEQGEQGPARFDQSSAALAGESAAAFAARSGLDPRAWRALGLNGANPSALPAGLRIRHDHARPTEHHIHKWAASLRHRSWHDRTRSQPSRRDERFRSCNRAGAGSSPAGCRDGTGSGSGLWDLASAPCASFAIGWPIRLKRRKPQPGPINR